MSQVVASTFGRVAPPSQEVRSQAAGSPKLSPGVKVVLRVGSGIPSARRVVAATLLVGALASLCVLLAIGHAGPSHSQLHPDMSPETVVLAKMNRTGMRKMLDGGRESLARGFVSVGASLDSDAVAAYTPSKGYIRKALERTRKIVEEHEAERVELQAFYEKELAKLNAQLKKEGAVLEEVLGDDYADAIPSFVAQENTTKELR